MSKGLGLLPRALAKLALLLVSTAVLVVVAELAVRVLVARGIAARKHYRADLPMPNVQVHPNPEVGYLPPAHLADATGRLVTNRLGFREKDYSASDLTTNDVILNLGDSITFGDRVEDTADVYGHRLEQAIGRLRPGSRVIVYDAGVSGFNTWQEAALLGELLPTMNVKLVLLGFCLNDSSPRFHVRAGLEGAVSRYDQPAASVGSIFSREFFNRSYFYVLLKETIKNVQRAHPGAFPPGLLWHNLLVKEQRWRECKQALVTVRDRLGERGIPLVIAVFPYAHQLRLEPQANLIQNDLMAFCRDHGLECLDLFGAFKQHASEIVFDPEGTHPDKQGHAVAAQAIAEYLQERRLFPFSSEPQGPRPDPEATAGR